MSKGTEYDAALRCIAGSSYCFVVRPARVVFGTYRSAFERQAT